MTTLTASRIRENNAAVRAARLKPDHTSSTPSRALDRESDMSFRDQRIQLHGVGVKALCAYPGCHRFKDYYIGWDDPDGTVQWGMVCATHDKQIGQHNLSMAFPSFRKDKIVELDGILNTAFKNDLDEPQVRALLTTKGLAKCLTNAP